jgi:hypothetical protein
MEDDEPNVRNRVAESSKEQRKLAATLLADVIERQRAYVKELETQVGHGVK